MLSLLGPTPSVGSDEVESERRESPPGIPNADAFYVKNVKAAEDIQALRGDLFGDQVSLQTGSTEFRHVDVSVPTNGEVAVTLGRKYRVRFESLAGFTDPPDYSSHVVGADWVLDVPYITGTFEQRQYYSDHGAIVDGDGWTAGAALAARPAVLGRRCTVDNFAPAAQVPSLSQFYRKIGVDAHNYWTGNTISIPGSGEERMLSIRSIDDRPNDGRTYFGTTKSGWRISCLPSTLNSLLNLDRVTSESGEGFRVTLPNGVSYDFNWIARRKAQDFTDGSGNDDLHTLVYRDDYFLFATRATDRHGNWVAWDYDPANPFRLRSITSSDGVNITVHYNAFGKIGSVRHGSRVWQYQYSSSTATANLSAVILPDASRWTIAYQYGGASIDTQTYRSLCSYRTLSLSSGATPRPEDVSTITMTHPSGASGEFRFRNLLHGTNNTAGRCQALWFGGKLQMFTDGAPKAYVDRSLERKTIAGPGLPGYTWAYSYAPSFSYFDECSGGGCSTTSATTETRPDGSSVIHTYGNRYDSDNGRLLSRATRSAQGQTIRRETYTYLASAPQYPASTTPWIPRSNYGCDALTAPGQFFPEAAGCDRSARLDNPLSRANRPLVGVTIEQDGASFTTSHLSFDWRARPTRTRRGGSLGYTKTDDTSFHDNTARWVLGQVASVTNVDRGVVEISRQFDLDRGLPAAEFRFGKLHRTMAYRSDGQLLRETDGGGSWLEYSGYQRGIPTIVTLPTSDRYSAQVDDSGWVTSVTDPLLNVTRFDRDAVGRITGIHHPAADTTVWSSTFQAFEQVNVPEYGIGAGHWRRTADTGSRRSITYYDALWRPVLTREFDTANATAPARFVARRFDYDGRETFLSFPAAAAAEWQSVASGARTTYDAIGRVISFTQDSEQGPLTTTTSWLAGYEKRVTNPRGHSTTFTYRALGEPSDDQPVLIRAPEWQTTSFARDIWGKPAAIYRWGQYFNGTEWEWGSATRRFVYDGFQQLCKRIDPELGATVFEYDAGSKLAWSADGLSLPSTSDCDRASVPASSIVLRSYDNVNRLRAIDYPDSADDAGFTYSPDGELATATIGPSGNQVVWSYQYNKRRLLESERLSVDGRVFELLHRYNDRGDRSQLRYPDGEWLSTFPDALGRATQLAGSSGSYASGIQYHPNGVLAALSYGNGVTYVQPVNARGLPSRRTFRRGGSQTLVDHSIQYDQNGNPVEIVDLFGSMASYANESRFLGYDGLDRLVTANSSAQPAVRSTPWQFSWGPGSFEYDALDHLRRAVIGPLDFRYRLDGQQRLASMSLAGSPFRSYAHNARGQMVQRGHDDGTHSLTWDSAHRLLQVNSSSGYWEAHRYDTHGRRVRTQRAGETVWSVYSRAGQLMFEQTASGIARRFVHLDDRLVAQTRNGMRDYVHTDLVGTVRMQTDALANVTLEDVRAPYGSVLLGRSYRNGFAYAGHVESAGTGLTYMEARHYDPISMRFLSPDPVYVDFGTGANFNRYAYANNSPYRYVDPDGRLPILVPVVVFIAKEVAGEAVEQATGVPMPTVKTAGRFVFRQSIKAEA
ncbi:MAG: RHS repeat domain-containing protein, partial [Pseudomonadota bacterium]